MSLGIPIDIEVIKAAGSTIRLNASVYRFGSDTITAQGTAEMPDECEEIEANCAILYSVLGDRMPTFSATPTPWPNGVVFADWNQYIGNALDTIDGRIIRQFNSIVPNQPRVYSNAGAEIACVLLENEELTTTSSTTNRGSWDCSELGGGWTSSACEDESITAQPFSIPEGYDSAGQNVYCYNCPLPVTSTTTSTSTTRDNIYRCEYDNPNYTSTFGQAGCSQNPIYVDIPGEPFAQGGYWQNAPGTLICYDCSTTSTSTPSTTTLAPYSCILENPLYYSQQSVFGTRREIPVEIPAGYQNQGQELTCYEDVDFKCENFGPGYSTEGLGPDWELDQYYVTAPGYLNSATSIPCWFNTSGL
jgi:hypothetical protein